MQFLSKIRTSSLEECLEWIRGCEVQDRLVESAHTIKQIRYFLLLHNMFTVMPEMAFDAVKKINGMKSSSSSDLSDRAMCHMTCVYSFYNDGLLSSRRHADPKCKQYILMGSPPRSVWTRNWSPEFAEHACEVDSEMTDQGKYFSTKRSPLTLPEMKLEAGHKLGFLSTHMLEHLPFRLPWRQCSSQSTSMGRWRTQGMLSMLEELPSEIRLPSNSSEFKRSSSISNMIYERLREYRISEVPQV